MKLISICYAWSIASAAIVGVDFGHKFTKAMMVAPGIRFEIIPTDGGNRKDLSAIYVDPKVSEGALKDTERAYGSQIGSLCSRSPQSCAANLKSLLGKRTSDAWVENYVQHNPHFKIVASKDRPDAIAFELGKSGKTFTFSAEELAAMSLADLKERVIKALTHHPQARAIAEDIVIAVPPYSSQLSRFAFRDTLSLANYSSVLGLVDEGCAAALAYVSDKKLSPEEYNGKTVHQIIYDVGAGSTTATLFSYTPFANSTILLDVESVGLDESFGGDLLTKHIYDLLYQNFLESFGLEKSFEIPFKAASRLMESAEKAKTILSANADSKVSLESFWDDKDFKTSISRSEFEEAVSHLLVRVTQPILDALATSPTGPKTIADIESVILNGGTTRTPFIQKQLGDFLGEGKVSKVLNADEACAYGTTIRAFQLKMMSDAANDIRVNDRILSDFEISLSKSAEKQLVFGKGSAAGNTSLVNLGKVTGDKAYIGLYENGQLYGTYNVTRLTSRASDLSCTADEVSLWAQFIIGEDKIFALDDIFVQCPDKPEATAGEVDEKNSTASNSTSKKIPRTKSRLSLPVLAFTSLRPYNHTEKRKFMSTMTRLKALEADKIVFDHTKNVLEGACYRLQFYIDENYEVLSENLGEDKLEIIQTQASDMVEWVDYESDSASLKELEEKLSDVEKTKSDLEATVRMSDSDLSLSALKDLLDEGNELAQKVQEYLLEFGSQTKTVREKYEADKFDFDAENAKITKKIFGLRNKDKFDLDKHFSDFKQALKVLTDMTTLSKSKFEKLALRKRFDGVESVTSLINEMVNDAEKLQKQHEQRITFLLTRLEKLQERKKQREEKAKLKEEKEKEKKSSSAETNSSIPDVENVSANSTRIEDADDIEQDSRTTSLNDTKSTPKAEDHDEL